LAGFRRLLSAFGAGAIHRQPFGEKSNSFGHDHAGAPTGAGINRFSRVGRAEGRGESAMDYSPPLPYAIKLPEHFQAKRYRLAARKMRSNFRSIFKPSDIAWRVGKCEQK
jgi:hypothetical protein